MSKEFAKPMLDVGSPRVFNCNLISQRVRAKDPSIPGFFRNKVLNNIVLIKDTLPEDMRRGSDKAIGTKLYVPFNENDIYEGGRTIFVSDRHLEAALVQHFGEGGINKLAFTEDFHILTILDRLPSLDPFLLKDVFLNEKINIHESYFEVSQEVWKEIEQFILQRFEPLVKAAFPDTKDSGERGRQLIEKIWEARDLEALDPLIRAFRLPKEQALEIFSAWKGINFYAFQYERAKPRFVELLTWLKDLKLPAAAVSAQEKAELKESLDMVRNQLRAEWQKADVILKDYQDSYDKMFKLKVSSTEFVAFLKNSAKMYWQLGNSLGKIGHASYCWEVTSKRFADSSAPWEALKEILQLLAKIFKPEKASTAVVW